MFRRCVNRSTNFPATVVIRPLEKLEWGDHLDLWDDVDLSGGPLNDLIGVRGSLLDRFVEFLQKAGEVHERGIFASGGIFGVCDEFLNVRVVFRVKIFRVEVRLIEDDFL